MTQSADWPCDMQLRDYRRILFKNSVVAFLDQLAPAEHEGFAPETLPICGASGADGGTEADRRAVQAGGAGGQAHRNGHVRGACRAHGSEQTGSAGRRCWRAGAQKRACGRGMQGARKRAQGRRAGRTEEDRLAGADVRGPLCMRPKADPPSICGPFCAVHLRRPFATVSAEADVS